MFTQFQSEFCKTQFAARYPQAAAAAGNRVESAARILAANAIRKSFDLPGIWEVKSESVSNRWYQIEPARKTCTCPDHRAGHLCKHRLAVGYMLSLAQWAGDDIQVTLQASHEAAQTAAERQALSLAYTHATAVAYGMTTCCHVSYGGIDQAAEVYSLVKDHQHTLSAIVRRLDNKPWYNNETHLAVTAMQCQDISIH